MGKSGQVPLHVWLPDAMKGPTPVSALIHAATMVAAGVFLVARVYPLMSAGAGNAMLITWVGAITAVFAATIAVAQTDIKRILAYSTVSQLGFMMMGLGVGGVAVGMFHLITHACFKALLFMGAGSVIHGCHDEQYIRFMGGLRKFMPVTFATYAVGMMALSGVPIFFSGFWSKDEIRAAYASAGHTGRFTSHPWALLTAFYMTRQVVFVFFGRDRSMRPGGPRASAWFWRAAECAFGSCRRKIVLPLPNPLPNCSSRGEGEELLHSPAPHESPGVMLWPLVILAACAMLLGFIGTPAWPCLKNFWKGRPQP